MKELISVADAGRGSRGSRLAQHPWNSPKFSIDSFRSGTREAIRCNRTCFLKQQTVPTVSRDGLRATRDQSSLLRSRSDG